MTFHWDLRCKNIKMWLEFVTSPNNKVVMSNLLVDFNNISNSAIHIKEMSICRITCNIYLLVLEDSLAKSQNNISTQWKSKMNSSKSTPQSSKHPFIIKNCMQKYLNILFRPNGDVEWDMACVSILHSSQWTTRNFFFTNLPKNSYWSFRSFFITNKLN